MVCDWEALLKILPAWMQDTVNMLGKEELQELRLRKGKPPELIFRGRRQWLRTEVTQEDLSFCINAASQYSPWAASTVKEGYLTAKGGHRMGICGEAVMKNGCMDGIRQVSGLCIRVARDFPGLADSAPEQGSVLILGAPGRGKTTLLRDLIRKRSFSETVSVVDERRELFPSGFPQGLQTDVLTDCPKSLGILQVLRTMGPQAIAVDEITAPEDCSALLQAFHCGISLFATAHAGSLSDFKSRPIYGPLIHHHIFDHVLLLTEDQSFREERVEP